MDERGCGGDRGGGMKDDDEENKAAVVIIPGFCYSILKIDSDKNL